MLGKWGIFIWGSKLKNSVVYPDNYYPSNNTNTNSTNMPTTTENSQRIVTIEIFDAPEDGCEDPVLGYRAVTTTQVIDMTITTTSNCCEICNIRLVDDAGMNLAGDGQERYEYITRNTNNGRVVSRVKTRNLIPLTEETAPALCKFIDAEVLSVDFTEHAFDPAVRECNNTRGEYDDKCINGVYLNVTTSAGIIQFCATNEHNGYYPHTVVTHWNGKSHSEEI
jgi:hypothetical protein